MRLLLRPVAVAAVTSASFAIPAAAQQGSIQLTGSAHAVHGDRTRIGDMAPWEPDGGISWLQPRSRIGTFQLELRGTRRGDEPHIGKAFAAWRNVKFRGSTWNVEVGDLFFTPAIGEYRFTNLSTPAITFMGASVSARTARTTASMVAGRITTWRNIFGSDADTLGQELALARVSHAPLAWLEINARASRIRTTNDREVSTGILSSDQAGGGLRVTAGPVQVVADASAVSYRRAGSGEQIDDSSMMAGVSLLLARGWVQVNVSRFSPGDFPLLNYPLLDRETIFAAGEYDFFKRLRLFGGWETFQSNLDPASASAAGLMRPETWGNRGFGGVRFHIAGRNSIAVRFEEGDRRLRRIADTPFTQSDTGLLSTELQTRAGPLTTVLRYSHRQHAASTPGSGYVQDDGSVQVFGQLSRRVQLFGTGIVTRNSLDAGGGTTYYQFGGGGQAQIGSRPMWLRVEGLTARNIDLLTQTLVARTSMDVGFNGQVARNTMVGLSVHADLLPPASTQQNPWATRTLLRVTRSFPIGSIHVAGTPAADTASRSRGTGSVSGLVFEDWNADGIVDAGERPLEGIPVLLGSLGGTATSARGEFTFVNVPAGVQRVALDVSALPVEFDAPSIPSIQIELDRGDAKRVTFGVVPLGTVRGRVLRDANGDGKLDAADEPMDGAVVVMDDGARSEQVRTGRFRFEAVRSGAHTIDLLPESLPDGATIIGERSVSVALTRAQPNPAIDFLVSIEKRPEIRRVFPAGRGGGATPAPPARSPGVTPARATPARTAPSPTAKTSDGAFTIQIIAVRGASRAVSLMNELKAAGYPAYLVEPIAGDPLPLYRVRVGRFATRAAVDAALVQLEQLRGEKLWVIKER